ncbi:MAG: hypothetical protein KDA72_08780 [Planctomycetales bacterium]|nr:hypothetical protein [Planctomycetales bacterium]
MSILHVISSLLLDPPARRHLAALEVVVCKIQILALVVSVLAPVGNLGDVASAKAANPNVK